MKINLFKNFFFLVVGLGMGFYLHAFTFPQPDCVCPKVPPCPKCPDLELQSVDINKVKGVRGFTLNQNFTVKLDSIQIKNFCK